MRKVIREAKWTVTLTPAGQQAQQIQKQVEAPTQDAAIRRVMQDFGGTQFTRAEAVAVDPQVVPPGQQPIRTQQQLPRQLVGLQPLRQMAVPGQQQQQQQQQPLQQESIDPKNFRYPYAIRLPLQFARVLRESAPVPVNEEYGQFEIVLKNTKDMQNFVGRLQRHNYQDLADIILDGIRRGNS